MTTHPDAGLREMPGVSVAWSSLIALSGSV